MKCYCGSLAEAGYSPFCSSNCRDQRLCDHCIKPIGKSLYAKINPKEPDGEPWRFCGATCARQFEGTPVKSKDLSDAVDHPSHYNSGRFEVAEVIEDWKLDFRTGNSVKYIARAGKKDPTKYVEDLKKAIWYLKRAIYLREYEEGKCDRFAPNAMKEKA